MIDTQDDRDNDLKQFQDAWKNETWNGPNDKPYDPTPPNESTGANEAKAAATDEYSDAWKNGPDAKPAEEVKPAEPAKPASFKEAFATARKAMLAGGPKVFEYNGKKYTTDLKSDKAAASPAAKPKAEVLSVVVKPTAVAPVALPMSDAVKPAEITGIAGGHSWAVDKNPVAKPVRDNGQNPDGVDISKVGKLNLQ